MLASDALFLCLKRKLHQVHMVFAVIYYAKVSDNFINSFFFYLLLHLLLFRPGKEIVLRQYIYIYIEWKSMGHHMCRCNNIYYFINAFKDI